MLERWNGGTVDRLIDRTELVVKGNDHRPTRCGKSCRSIIDLSLSTRRVGPLVTWEIDEDLATTSHHEVIVFAWSPHIAAMSETRVGNAQNWKIDRFCANEQAMKEAGEHWHVLSEGRPIINAWRTTVAGLEAEACWIQDNLKKELDKHALGRLPRAHSKRW